MFYPTAHWNSKFLLVEMKIQDLFAPSAGEMGINLKRQHDFEL